MPASSGRDRNGSSLTGRMGRRALQPLHAVAQAGRGALADEAERAIDGIMAGPIPEGLGRSLVEHRVVERLVVAGLRTTASDEAPGRLEELVARALDDPALRRTLARAVDATMTTELVDAIAGSPAFRRLLTRVVEAPEVRHALERQTAGLGADVVNGRGPKEWTTRVKQRSAVCCAGRLPTNRRGVTPASRRAAPRSPRTLSS